MLTPEVEPKVSVNCRQTPLRDVLRDLERQTGYLFRREGFDYWVLKREEGEKLQPLPRWRANAGNYTVFLERLRVVREFGTAGKSMQRLEIQLSLDAPTQDHLVQVAEWTRNLTALDDRGRSLRLRIADLMTGQGLWKGVEFLLPIGRPTRRIIFDLPQPGAKALRTLSSQIVLYERVEPLLFRFPLTEVPAAQRARGAVVSLQRVERTGREYQVELLIRLPFRDVPRAERAEFRLTDFRLALVEVAGRRHFPTAIHLESTSVTAQMRVSFPLSKGTEPTLLLCELPAKYKPSRRLTYRFTNVPLP